ncbi:MAG: MFS transporter, partial [Ferrovibrio sp.]
LVMGAPITNRWFATNRGLVMGLLTASTATGTLIFIPLLSLLAEMGGWPLVTWTVALAAAALIPLVWWLLPERPSDMGLLPYGATETPAAAGPAQNPLVFAVAALGRASKKADFWFLFATFWICGFTTNGLVGTHLLSFCGDMGLAVTTAAGVLALMGFFDLFGTTASGWLTDRYDPRKLLFMYYGLRGLSLVYLPYTDFSLA